MKDIPSLAAGLEATGYLADEPLATALFLAVHMGAPILLEGEPGVGKTAAAKALAEALDTPLVRLQCYAAGGAGAEVFTFATRLTRLTPALAGRPSAVLERAARTAPDWSGGTRIGATLREFVDHFGRPGLARGAVILIVSDGWDTGEPAELGHQMGRLSRLAYRIVWANPRAQSPRYRPLAGGMAAAWPHCDAVVSAHSLAALPELVAALVDPRRRPISLES